MYVAFGFTPVTTASKSGVTALFSVEGSGGSSWMIFFAMVHAPPPVKGFWAAVATACGVSGQPFGPNPHALVT